MPWTNEVNSPLAKAEPYSSVFIREGNEVEVIAPGS